MRLLVSYTHRDLFQGTASADIECPWPSLPRKGEELFHCGDWGGDTVGRVAWSLDGTAEMAIGGADEELLAHLVAEHGFTRWRP